MTFKKVSLISLFGVLAILSLREAVVTGMSESQAAEPSAAPALIEPAAGIQGAPPPPASFNETLTAASGAFNDAVRISPGKSEIIHLEQDAASVIVSNPAHAAIMLDSPRVLIVLPRAPGATSFTVLDATGKTIMEKKVIVSSGREPYVRVRKICTGGDPGCAPSSYYYCPDGCYEVSTGLISQTGSSAVPDIPADASSASTAQTQDTTQGTGDEGEEEVPEDVIDENTGTGTSTSTPTPPPLPANGATGGEQ